MEDDQKTTEQEASIVELLAMPEAADIEFEPPRLKQGRRQPEELVSFINVDRTLDESQSISLEV